MDEKFTGRDICETIDTSDDVEFLLPVGLIKPDGFTRRTMKAVDTTG